MSTGLDSVFRPTHSPMSCRRVCARGMIFKTADTESFRRRLGARFHQRWKSRLGASTGTLLEAKVGKLG